MIQAAIAKLVEGTALSFDEARDSVGEILAGLATPSQVAGFLTALRMKGETTDEIAGCAQAMRAAASRIELSVPVVLDTCGTGGDKQGSFNVSTAAALVAAGAGFTVAKHGNRSISSQCGSADVLEELGVKVDASKDVVTRCLNEVGIAFLFAPAFHPAMKHAMPTRRELAVRTVFNILGPLCNPAGANAQVIGVFSPKMCETVAKVLARLGTKNAMAVHSAGHDEITLYGPTLVWEVSGGKVRKRQLAPKDFGLKKHARGALKGGDKVKNADIVRSVLSGEPGPARDVTLANAAAAIFTASRASGKPLKTLRDAVIVAAKSVDSGAAREKLQRLADLSRSAG